jgi:hypothetical protein
MVSVVGRTTLSSDADVTGLILVGVNGMQTVMVTKAVSLSFTATGSGVSMNVTNLLFNLTSSALTSSLFVAVSNSYPSVNFILSNCLFNYRATLSVPLVSISGVSNVDLNNVGMYRAGTGAVSNADDSICVSQRNNAGLSLTNSVGRVSQSTFSGLDTGALSVSGGTVTLEGVTFINNSAVRQSGFPNLRHNVFVSNNAQVNVLSIFTDTGNSYFIYISETSGGAVPNIVSPLFTPVLRSAQPPSLSAGEYTMFAFTGASLYPCGLYFNFYRDDPSNVQSQPIVLNVPDENTATVTLANSLFAEEGRYFGYLVYGPGARLQTPPVEMLVGSTAPSQPNRRGGGLGGGVVGAVVAIAALVVVIVLFLLWRWRIKQRWITQTESELFGALPGEDAKVPFLFLFLFSFFF